jgi:4-amino-4-deoxy-L-arabinose transferase-like glycosyltransferase
MRLDPVRAAVLGALFAALVTLPGLGNGTLWDNSETVYGEVAREIVLSHDWVVMHLNAQPWFVQPPLYFWIAAAFAKLAGATPFAMRLPSALATIAMAAAVGYATARKAGARAGTLAAIVLSTCLMQAVVGRLAIMDALLDLCVTVAILLWYFALGPDPAEPSPVRRSTAFVLGAVALALGTLAKGPVAPVIVVLVVGVWAIWEWRSGTRIVPPARGALAAALVVCVALVLPWFLLVTQRAGPQAIGELIGHYTVGRFTGVIENQHGPWFYYLPVLLIGFFPWIAFLPVGLWRAAGEARRRDGSFARLAIAWAIVPLVFFSCAQTKLPNYIALLLPALAMLVGMWFDRLTRGLDRRAGLISAAAIPLLVVALAIAVVQFARANQLNIETVAIARQFAGLGIGMLAGSLLTIVALAWPRVTASTPYVLAATTAALLLFIAFVSEPAAEPFKPIPYFARIINAERGPHSTVAVRNASGSYALMFDTVPGVATIDGDRAAFVGLICPQADVFLVTRARDAGELTAVARSLRRQVRRFGDVTGVTMLRIDGPRCASG